MENNIFRQSSFSRTIINEAKMGAYYTDAEHCRRIGRLLDFPEEFIALEPSIGDGSAIAATLEEATVLPKIYGVELNQNTYEEIKDDERFYVLPADFLTGVVVSNRVFSYCFSNPPYGVGEDGKTRLEKSFLEKISNYMCPEGILVYVIPYQVLQEERFLRSLFSRFTPLAVFKFDDKEFEKYHQVVVIAQKRSREGYLRDWYEKFKEQISEISNISYLPTIDEPVDRKIPVPPSSDEKLTYFTTREFDAEEELLLSKEKRLIDIIRKEQAEGRNVVVYAEYTASPETCITYRLKEIIEKYCNLKGKVEVLESSSPAAREREAWMHKKAAEGIKVFITNPRCVSTGLDFCFVKDGIKYNYPTLIFYQLGYSMFVTWQASRRAYRLNQTKECRNYYLAWSGSVQEAVISLIAEKQAATSAIQGKFSTEGLAAMANGVDERMKLAQAMANMDSITGNNLQEMFDVLQQDLESTEYRDYKPMLLYKELVGEEEAPTESFDAIKTGQLGIFDLFETMDDSRSQEPSDTDRVIDTVFVESSVPVLHLHTAKAVGKKKVVSGQLSLF